MATPKAQPSHDAAGNGSGFRPARSPVVLLDGESSLEMPGPDELARSQPDRSFPPRGELLLDVRGLVKKYGKRQVVRGVSFQVHRGEVVGLLGPNGAGKTTSFRMTIGLIDSDGGQVMFVGDDVTQLPMYLRARSGMGYLAQDSSVFKQLTVENNLMAILETQKMSRSERRDRQEELLRQFGLEKIRKTMANRVSGGERRRLEIARCLITKPKLIMLDEPFAGIDPKTVSEIQDEIGKLAARDNMGVLLTDHNVYETLQVTNRSYLIHEGKVVVHGTAEEIINNEDAKKYYLGSNFDAGRIGHDRHPHRPTTRPAGVAIPGLPGGESVHDEA